MSLSALQKKETFFTLNTPEVLEERNKLIAAHIGNELNCSSGKIQGICGEIDVFSNDPTPRRLIEYLYEKLWTTKPGCTREDAQKIITRCHAEALERMQKIYPDMWNIWVAVGE